jgi:hypothetical protein
MQHFFAFVIIQNKALIGKNKQVVDCGLREDVIFETM